MVDILRRDKFISIGITLIYVTLISVVMRIILVVNAVTTMLFCRLIVKMLTMI